MLLVNCVFFVDVAFRKFESIFVKQFELGNLMKTLLFKIDFPNDQKSFTFLVLICLDYHFVQSDLVGSGFLKA